MENYIKGQLLDVINNYKRLVGIYSKWNFSESTCFHLLETTKALESMIGIEHIYEDGETTLKIKKKLLSKGIKTGEIRISYYEDNKTKIILTAWLKNGCARTEIMTRIISEILGKTMSVGGRSILTTTPNEYVFEESPVFYELHGAAMMSKNKGEVSGDAYTFIDSRDRRFTIAISDGMGTGEFAAKDSGDVMDFIEEYIEAGFDVDRIPYIINEAMIKNCMEKPVTIDLSTIDMNTGKVTMIKSGGATTFIKRGKEVKNFCPSSLPLGVINEVEPYMAVEQLMEGDYIIMISDGVIDSLPFYDKEKQFSEIIQNTKECNAESMAKHILDECSYYNGGNNTDDMTVLVTGIWKIKSLHWKKS